MRSAAQKIAHSIRHGAQREHERRGTGRKRATVLSTSPLLLDLHDSDMELDADDVTIGKSVTAAGFDVDDVLIIVEVDENEWVAVDVEEED